MKIRLSKQSERFLNKLSSSKEGKQITIKIQQLAVNGHLNDSKKLKGGLSDFYRTDTGEYRVIYKIEDNNLYIFVIGKRNDNEVYKTAERSLNINKKYF